MKKRTKTITYRIYKYFNASLSEPLLQIESGAWPVGGGVWEVSPALFKKLQKSALILDKKALVVVIYGLKCNF